MKTTAPHIEKIRRDLIEMAKAKSEHIAYFKKGGPIDRFKPRNMKLATPFLG